MTPFTREVQTHDVDNQNLYKATTRLICQMRQPKNTKKASHLSHLHVIEAFFRTNGTCEKPTKTVPHVPFLLFCSRSTITQGMEKTYQTSALSSLDVMWHAYCRALAKKDEKLFEISLGAHTGAPVLDRVVPAHSGVDADGVRAVGTSTEYIYTGNTLLATVDQKMVNGVNSGTATTTYIHPDNLGSTQVTSDKNGTLVQAFDYAPYGSVLSSTGTGVSVQGREYISQFSDNSGLDYLNARYLNPAQGQFTTEDPVFLGTPGQQNIKDPQSLNSYSYSDDNPITGEDPSGKNVKQTLANIQNQLNTIQSQVNSLQVQVGVLANNYASGSGVANHVFNTLTKTSTPAYIAGGIGIVAGGGAIAAGAGIIEAVGTAGTLCEKYCDEGDSSSIESTNAVDSSLITQHALNQMSERGITLDQFNDTVLNGESFSYFHQGVDKIGYYNPETAIFTGQVQESGNFTTVINNVKPQYIENLKNLINSNQ
jgi:RHS repeat-associated protein